MELLTSKSIYDCATDGESEELYNEQDAVFAKFFDHGMYDGYYVFLINDRKLYFGSMSDFFDCYVTKDGNDLYRMDNGHFCLVLREYPKTTRAEILAWSQMPIRDEY